MAVDNFADQMGVLNDILDGKEPEGKEPEPEGKAPEGQDPEGKAPEGQDPEGKEPDGKEPEPEGKEPDGKEPKTKESQQQYAFAQLRVQNKQYNSILSNLGKALGVPEGTNPEDIATQVEQLLLERQSKETNVPVEMLQRVNQLESIVAENAQIKRENETTKAFNALAEKYNLDADGLNDFAKQLVEAGANPLEKDSIDIEAEFIKHNYDKLLQSEIQKALEAEKERKEKADQHAGSSLPGNSNNNLGDKSKIETVSDLDKYFSSLDM